MLKVFYDKSLLLDAKRYHVFPLVELLEEEESTLLLDQYKMVNSIKDCDFALLPMSIQFLFQNKMKTKVYSFFEKCEKVNKKVLTFSGGDFGVTISNKNIYTIRLGGFHSKMNEQTFIMPPFICEPYDKLHTTFKTLPKTEKPTIGFVGHSNGSTHKFIKEYLLFIRGNLNRIIKKDTTDFQAFYPSSIKRHTYLKRLSLSDRLSTDFIFRSQYRAGVKTIEEIEKTTKEFYQNIYDNLYTFCIRGTGNFSVRFYETLAMGRIPILIDTDCRLPFLELINWNEHCVIISEKEVDNIENKILSFHMSKTEEEIKIIQQKNRKLWQDYFCKHSYFVQLESILQTKVINQI